MAAPRSLTPISHDIARRGVDAWGEGVAQRLRAEGEAIQRDLQAQAQKMRTVSGDDLKVRSR